MASVATGEPMPGAVVALGMTQMFLPNSEFELYGVPVTRKTTIGTALVIDHSKLKCREPFNLDAIAEKRGVPVEKVVEEQKDFAIKVLVMVEKNLPKVMPMSESMRKAIVEINSLILELIETERIDLCQAVQRAQSKLAESKTEDKNLKQRIELQKKMLEKIVADKILMAMNVEEELNAIPGEKVAFVVDDLKLQDVWLVDRQNIRTVIREKGNPGDHVSGYINRHEKAGLVAVAHASKVIVSGVTVINDGIAGKVIVNPRPATLERYEKLIEEQKRIANELKAMRALAEVKTIDRQTVVLKSEVEWPQQIENHRKHGIHQFGIVRTEFFFCKKPGQEVTSVRTEQPSIKEQLEFYQEIIDKMGGEGVLFRTIDPSNDKGFPYFVGADSSELSYLEEKNVYNLCFLDQLEALLQCRGKIKILFPSLRTAKDFDTAMQYVEKVKVKLIKRAAYLNAEIVFGAMVENVEMVENLSNLLENKKVSFVVVGPKDLTQSATGISRFGSSSAKHFDHLDPEVVKQLAIVVSQVNESGKEIHICEGMRDEWEWFMVLLALGYRSISVSTGFVDLAKKIISNVDSANLERLREVLKEAATKEELRKDVHRFTQEMMSMNEIEEVAWTGLREVQNLLFPEKQTT